MHEHSKWPSSYSQLLAIHPTEMDMRKSKRYVRIVDDDQVQV